MIPILHTRLSISPTIRTTALLLIAACTMCGASSGSLAQVPTLQQKSQSEAVTVEELQAERAIRQREQVQQLQQRNRQQDRNDMRYRPERLEVPVIRPSCSSSVYGSSVSAGCR